MDGTRPWWADKEPNFARLQMAVVRREVILGRDEVLKLESVSPQAAETKKEKDQNGGGS